MKEKDEKIALSAQIQNKMIEELFALNSDLKKALKKQKQLTEMKSRFVSITSHEFRTPLTTIQTNIELLMFQMQDEPPDQQEKKGRYYNRILSEIGRLTDLMNDILMLGRLDSGKIPFNPSPISIVNICTEIITERFSEMLDGRKVEFTIAGDCSNLYKLDSNVYCHIIINLLSNAFKFSEGKDNPRLELNCEKDYFTLNVIDNGIGIPDKERKQMFETFYRASNADYIQGTGLGLSIVKQFVTLHNGLITFETEEGIGSTFSIYQPSLD